MKCITNPQCSVQSVTFAISTNCIFLLILPLISMKDIQFAFKWDYIVNSSWLRRRSNLSSKSVSIAVRIWIVIWATSIGVKLRKQRKLQPHKLEMLVCPIDPLNINFQVRTNWNSARTTVVCMHNTEIRIQAND